MPGAVLLQLLVLALLTPIPGASPARAAVIVKDNLYAVKAIGPSEAWVVGNFGAIYHSTDAGRTWEPRDSGVKQPLFGVDFADAADGWAVGKSALVLHTQDGGRSWKRQKTPIPAEKHLFNVQAIDAMTVWAVGDWGAITVTHDGGATWVDRSLGTLVVKTEESPGRHTQTLTDDVILYDLSFPDAQHGFIAGEFGTVLATRDGGGTWERQSVGTEKTLFGISFSTPEKGWAVGIEGLIIRTTDGGRTWRVQRGAAESASLDELGFLEAMKNPGLYAVRVAGSHGVVVGDTGTLLVSDDGGESWKRCELPEREGLVWIRGVSLAGGTRGFAVGSGGFTAALDGERVTLPDAP